jgi:CRP-like cAMP-binding protein
MNEAINNRVLSTKETRPAHHGPGALASPQLTTETLDNNKHRRAEAKVVPFSGLLTNKLLARLPGEEFARLLPYMKPVSLDAGEYVYGLGDKVEYIYFPETVVISHIHLLEDGNTTEVALIGNEGLVGLSALFGAPSTNYWSQVIVEGTALRVRVEVLKEDFNRGQSMQRLMLSYTSQRIAQISQRAVCNGRHTLSGRLASWLLMIHDRAGEGALRLTHEEIARHLGARRASISVAATILRDRGIISYNRGNIKILDRQLLLNNACECYRTLARYAAA